MDRQKMLDSFFHYKLGHGVKFKKDPDTKMVVQERLLCEFLESTKPRRIMYACKTLSTGKVELYAEQTLGKWVQNQKTLDSNNENKSGGTVSQIHAHSSVSS